MDDTEKPFGEVIHSYTRSQAIEDGVLVEVSEMGREAGFRFPVALTSAVWEKYVEVPHGVAGQDLLGRLWDLLYMFRISIRNSRYMDDEIEFKLHVRNDNLDRVPPLITLKGVFGYGDKNEPVITIMLLEED